MNEFYLMNMSKIFIYYTEPSILTVALVYYHQQYEILLLCHCIL